MRVRSSAPEPTQSERILALLDHLGLERAHIATQMPGDIGDLARTQADRIAGLVLAVPTRLDPAPFASLADRLLMIAGAKGLSAETTARAAAAFPSARRVVLDGYDAPGWADVVADRTQDITFSILAHLGTHPGASVPRVTGSGTHAGITWHIEGSGPALVLLPFFLAPSQWRPAMPELTRRFSVVTLGGAHIGGVAALEDRARAPTYQAMFRTLVDLLDVKHGERILDVGCGAGSLDRLLAQRVGANSPITAMDINPFLIGEARALTEAAGLSQAITFTEGSAEKLPFPEASFEHAFSVTVLEECDADKAIAEMVRVTKPGGRIGIVVRAIDLPQWWNMRLPAELRPKTDVPPQSVGATGVADASLYARMRNAGLIDLIAFPSLVTLDRPGSPIWRYREDHVLSQLTPAELTAWHTARADADAAGLLLSAHALHCAVATRP
jgi:SAM-dependent methyltransferase